MTIFYDAGSEQQKSVSAATSSFTHTATAANVVGVLISFVKGGTSGSTDNIRAVSYGGVSLVRINRATDTTTEPGSAEWWFASNPGSGAKSVSYNSVATD